MFSKPPLFALFLLSTAKSAFVWNEIQGSFRDFLDGDGNMAEDYLIDGLVNWYQLKVRLHGNDYFIPISVASDRRYSILQGKFRFIWTFTLPVEDIKIEQRQTYKQMTAKYGIPRQIHESEAVKSCMKIIKRGDQFIATISSVNANKHYSGREIMAIFMIIAVKKNSNITPITLADSSTKYCPMLRQSHVDRVPQSVFMGFLGRLDFYREYGFFVARKTEGGVYKPDEVEQKKNDIASMKLREMKVNEVIRAATDDGFRDRILIKRLIDDWLEGQNANQTAFVSTYLKVFSDDWPNQCDKYVEAVEALKQIPSIKVKYFDNLKVKSVSTLIWMESELNALNERLRAVQQR